MEKRGSEHLARHRVDSQGIGKRHRSGHKAGASLEEEALKSIAIIKKMIKEEVEEELTEKLRKEVMEELNEEVRKQLEEQKKNIMEFSRQLEEQKKNFMWFRKQLEELKEKAALERPDDAFLARRSELHESKLKLKITSTVKSVVYKRRPIETSHGRCVVVTMFDGTDKIAPDHRLSSAEVELVILNGAFNGAAEERWSKQEFEDQIFDNLIEGKSGTEKMNQKKKKDNQGCQPMIKNSIFKLTGGSCSHVGACIMGNSNRGAFRLGVRLVGHATERVLEGISNSFKVQEYKTKDNAKDDKPSIDSEIWRLRRIARNSEACSAIEKKGLDTVGRLLISHHEDNDKLREILRGHYHRSADVDAIIDHAKECEDGLCSYTTDGITLFFNQIETLVGVQISDRYSHFSALEGSEKDTVKELAKQALEDKATWCLDYKMENDRPKPWLPKVSNPFIEKNIVGSGSSVPTSAQMEEKAQATIGCDEKGSIQDRQENSDGRAHERIQMMHDPSAQASSPNVHNVQGEAGLGNTGEPSAEKNSVMACVPATEDCTRRLFNQLQPQGHIFPQFDYQTRRDASLLSSFALHIREPSVDCGGDGQFTSIDEDMGLPVPAREQYTKPGFAVYIGQSSFGFANTPYFQSQNSSGFAGTPGIQVQSSSARSELQALYLGGRQLGSGFIHSIDREFIGDGPQFGMPQ